MSEAVAQSTKTVFESHLALQLNGQIEEDIAAHYAPEVVLLTGNGIFTGHDGVRQFIKLLNDQLPEIQLTFETQHVSGEIAFLEWTGKSYAGEVHDGTDTFLIRDGKILVQTIHYTVARSFFH